MIMPEVRRYVHQDRLNYPRGTPCQKRFRTLARLVGDLKAKVLPQNSQGNFWNQSIDP